MCVVYTRSWNYDPEGVLKDSAYKIRMYIDTGDYSDFVLS